MHTDSTRDRRAFKRQIVFRISQDDWPLLEAAASEHGSIQAAILAGLQALAQPGTSTPEAPPESPAKSAVAQPESIAAADEDPNEEIRARHAAAILGVKSSTASGYIRAGRLPGRYDDTLGCSGWVTTRGAVDAYRRRIRRQ